MKVIKNVEIRKEKIVVTLLITRSRKSLEVMGVEFYFNHGFKIKIIVLG